MEWNSKLLEKHIMLKSTKNAQLLALPVQVGQGSSQRTGSAQEHTYSLGALGPKITVIYFDSEEDNGSNDNENSNVQVLNSTIFPRHESLQILRKITYSISSPQPIHL